MIITDGRLNYSCYNVLVNLSSSDSCNDFYVQKIVPNFPISKFIRWAFQNWESFWKQVLFHMYLKTIFNNAVKILEFSFEILTARCSCAEKSCEFLDKFSNFNYFNQTNIGNKIKIWWYWFAPGKLHFLSNNIKWTIIFLTALVKLNYRNCAFLYPKKHGSSKFTSLLGSK